ncbi:MAG: magnesium-translocating P-type ATPase, partial [Mycobacteriaceae bacterium]|nr:magnesium-translocating P-type ATPase [Mycobacteriaceae bacterium]
MSAHAFGNTSPDHLVHDADAPLRAIAEAPVLTVLAELAASPRGLTEGEAADRLRRFGDNEPFRAGDDGLRTRLIDAFRSPFVALLAGLGVVFVLLGDPRGAVTVAVMVMLAVGVRVWQQTRSVRATRALQDLVT